MQITIAKILAIIRIFTRQQNMNNISPWINHALPTAPKYNKGIWKDSWSYKRKNNNIIILLAYFTYVLKT
jgi:hypothetical protein